jgi:hypothetical protein
VKVESAGVRSKKGWNTGIAMPTGRLSATAVSIAVRAAGPMPLYETNRVECGVSLCSAASARSAAVGLLV